MKNDPLLASTVIPAGRDGYKVARKFEVRGGLHMLKGNTAPYFSLTCDVFRKGFPNQCQSGGADHAAILKRFPRFADIAALHLSDINGVPTHAEANGWYNLAGALGGMGEQYHVGNSERHFPIDPPADKPWQTTEYRKPTQAECLHIFAEHCRVSIGEASKIVDQCIAGIENDLPLMQRNIARQRWAAIMETMRPRWKAEAEACIKTHGLRVYGDAYLAA